MSRARVAVLLAVGLVAASLSSPRSTSAGLLPVAVNDSYSAVHGRLRTVAAPGVLGNDLQLGGGFTADLRSDVDHGSLDLDPDGGFRYRSDESFVGTDQFTYRVNGGLLGLSNTATVTITVTNDAPVASPDAYSAVADVEKTIAAPGVLANDDDADGDAMTIDVVQEPAHGNLNEDDDGSFRYKADDGFSGTDTWRYRVWDGIAWSNTVTVTMTVSAPPTPTPKPTPKPTPTPAPTPASTPRPSPTPTPGPTLGPVPTLPPPPTLPPLPTLVPPGTTPQPTTSPRPSATATPTTRPSPTPTADPTTTIGGAGPASPVGPGGPVTTPGSVASVRPPAADPTAPLAEPPFTLPTIDDDARLAFDTSAVSFGGFEWAVPALVLTVPGILIVILVLVQMLIGLAWLPVARRWLGGDRRRRAALAGVSPR